MAKKTPNYESFQISCIQDTHLLILLRWLLSKIISHLYLVFEISYFSQYPTSGVGNIFGSRPE